MVAKFTTQPTNKEVVTKINEVIDALGTASGANTDLSNLSATGETHINNSVIAILELMYPVGAIFVGTTSTCPMAQFFGTWTLVAADRVLQGSSSNHAANSTINASLPTLSAESNGAHTHNRGTMDITGWFTGGRSGTTGVNGCFVSKTNGSDAYSSGSSDMYQVNFKGSSGWSGSTNSTGAHTHSVIWTDHVGTTVQPPAYVVNVWRRTA